MTLKRDFCLGGAKLGLNLILACGAYDGSAHIVPITARIKKLLEQHLQWNVCKNADCSLWSK